MVVVECRINVHTSIHAPREGSDNNLMRFFLIVPDFNPRSCEESNLFESFVNPQIQTSIHAPVKGATQTATAQPGHDTLQSTLSRGERQAPGTCPPTGRLYFNSCSLRRKQHRSCYHPLADFNPCSQQRERHPDQVGCPQSTNTSIHAPVKGATFDQKAV